MVWDAKGEDRIKSYRLYRDLEDKYNEALAEVELLRAQVKSKDELIRRMAAEIAMLPSDTTHHGVRDVAADAALSSSEMSRKLPTVPAIGNGDKTVEVSDTGSTIRGVRPGGYSHVGKEKEPTTKQDPLAHIATPKRKKA